jgi:hypothetical protein
VEAEIIHVQRKGAVVVLLHRFPDFIDVARRPVGRHAHHFVFTFVHFEAEESRECAIEQTDGMRKLDLLGQLDLRAASYSASRRQPFADTINGQNRRFLKRRAEKRARSVRKMVLREENAIAADSQFRLQGTGDPQLVQHPADHGFAENFPRLRISLQDADQQPVELSKRPLIKDHVVQVFGVDLRFTQAKLDGVFRKTKVVLDAGKALLLGGGNKLAVAQDRSGSIVVITGNSKDVHQLLPVGPIDIVDFGGMLKPFRGAMLDAQRIGKKANHQAKGQDRDGVDDRQNHARLEIPDLVRQALPRVPKSFQVFNKNIGHSVAIRLKESVDERRESRALSQNDKNGGKEHH